MRDNIGLYRGKRKDNGEWVKGSLLRRTNPCIEQFEFANDGVPEPYIYEVIPETVGECTNVPDMKGKLIFEGDFIQINEDVKNAFRVNDGVVEYIGGAFRVKGGDGSLLTSLFAITDIYWVMRGQVIGNVYDNPELLKENNK